MNNLIGIGISPKDAKFIPKHSHSYWEIIYILKGSGVFSSAGMQIEFSPGYIICQPPHIPHNEVSTDGFEDIFFTVEFFDFTSHSPLLFKDNESGDFHKILMLMYKEFHLRRNNWVQLVDSLLNVLNNYISAWNDKPCKNTFVERFEKTIVSNIGNCNFQLASAIHSLPISSDYFRKFFKKETGKSPHDYLVEKRMELAKYLLINHYYDDSTIKLIASQVGYNDQYHFSKAFKKHTGMCPSLWIRKKAH